MRRWRRSSQNEVDAATAASSPSKFPLRWHHLLNLTPAMVALPSSISRVQECALEFLKYETKNCMKQRTPASGIWCMVLSSRINMTPATAANTQLNHAAIFPVKAMIFHVSEMVYFSTHIYIYIYIYIHRTSAPTFPTCACTEHSLLHAREVFFSVSFSE